MLAGWLQYRFETRNFIRFNLKIFTDKNYVFSIKSSKEYLGNIRPGPEKQYQGKKEIREDDIDDGLTLSIFSSCLFPLVITQ